MVEEPIVEVRQRARRIETRLTQLMIALGVATDGQKPKHYPSRSPVSGGQVLLPSAHCTLKEILDAIPAPAIGLPVDLYLGADRIARITKC